MIKNIFYQFKSNILIKFRNINLMKFRNIIFVKFRNKNFIKLRNNNFIGFRNNNFINFKIRVLIITVILIVIVGVIMFFPHFFRNTYIVTVTNKRVVKYNNVDKYLIYTQMEDGNIMVFEDTNDLTEFKFNSETLYWVLQVNRKYEIKAYGLSIPSLEYYQNIIKVKGVEK